MRSLNRLKLAIVLPVAAFLIAFEYIRHVLFPQLLHNWPAYLISVATVAVVLLVVNEWVFGKLRDMQAGMLDAVLDSSGNSIIIADRAGTIEQWSRAAAEIYGWSRAEVIGRNMPMVPNDRRAEAKQLVERLWSGETVRNIETQRLTKSGEVIPVLLTASPIRDEKGDVVRVLGISTDLREHKRLEQELVRQQTALAAFQERDRLARELHDGLGQVLGFVNTQSQAIREMLARGQTDAAVACLRELTEVAQDAHADVREYILSLKTDAPRGPFVPELRNYLARFSLSTGIRAELVADAALGDDPFDAPVHAQLLRIIQEALTNARKHARATRVTVSVTARDGRATVEVADDGAGFDASRALGDHGRHFGLRIMRDRASDVGGTVEVRSGLGEGTRVTATVPWRGSEG